MLPEQLYRQNQFAMRAQLLLCWLLLLRCRRAAFGRSKPNGIPQPLAELPKCHEKIRQAA